MRVITYGAYEFEYEYIRIRYEYGSMPHLGNFAGQQLRGFEPPGGQLSEMYGQRPIDADRRPRISDFEVVERNATIVVYRNSKLYFRSRRHTPHLQCIVMNLPVHGR